MEFATLMMIVMLQAQKTSLPAGDFRFSKATSLQERFQKWHIQTLKFTSVFNTPYLGNRKKALIQSYVCHPTAHNKDLVSTTAGAPGWVANRAMQFKDLPVADGRPT